MIRGPWNVIVLSRNAIMGPCNVKWGQWNVNTGPVM